MRQSVIIALVAMLALLNVVLAAPTRTAVPTPTPTSSTGPASAPATSTSPKPAATPNSSAGQANLLPNGDYTISSGSRHNPSYYFTGYTNQVGGYVTLESRDSTKWQVWRLRNHSTGHISLEIVGRGGYYLGPGRSGVAPGAYLGVNSAAQTKWDIKRLPGPDQPRYKLISLEKYDNRTLVVDRASESVDPSRVAYQYDDPSTIQAWRFSLA